MDYQTKSWMHDLAYNLKIEGFKDRPLCQIALPGTHDSGTYGIDLQSAELTPDAELAVSSVFVAPGGRLLVYSWAVSQKKSITEQLNSGSRYLDLRVTGKIIVVPGIKADLNEPCICHSLKSIEVRNVIEQVAAFLQENNREVVILDFQHFYDMTTDQHNKIVSHLRNKLGDMMISPQLHTPELTLRKLEGEFKNKGRCIIIYNKEGESAEIIDKNKDIF